MACAASYLVPLYSFLLPQYIVITRSKLENQNRATIFKPHATILLKPKHQILSQNLQKKKKVTSFFMQYVKTLLVQSIVKQLLATIISSKI